MKAKKIIDDFIKDNLEEYFLLFEEKEENKAYLIWLENEIDEEIKILEERKKSNENINIYNEIQKLLKLLLFNNDTLIQKAEEKELDDFLTKNFGWYYIYNKEKVKEEYLNGKLKVEVNF